MGETRRMHYVPRTYLEKFGFERDDKYRVYALNKENGRLFDPVVKDICLENELYTLPGETEEERQLLEKMYGDLYESGYNTVYSLLTDKTRETVTAGERYSIISFVVSMLYRNNSWHNFHHQVTNGMIERAYLLSKEHGHDSFFFEDQEISIVGKTMEELQKEMRKENRPAIALVAAQTMFRLIRLRVINDIVSVTGPRPGYEFLTSDNPVIFQPADKAQHPIPFDPTNTLTIPIDSQHVLQLQPWRKELSWEMLGRLSEPVPGFMTSMFNFYQNRQSTRFLFGSETALKDFQARPTGILPPQ